MSAKIIPFRRKPGTRTYEPWIDQHALARHFAVTPRTIRNWRQAGMPSQEFSGLRRYRISECEDWHRQRAS